MDIIILSDKEMDIFNCSFTQKEKVLISSVNDWALQYLKQNLIVSPFLLYFLPLTHGPQKFQMAP